MLQHRKFGVLEGRDYSNQTKTLPAALKKEADALFDGRVSLRRIHEKLSDLMSDASGLSGIDNVYQSKDLREVHDLAYKLDQMIGETARALEGLARKIEKGTMK